MAEEAKEFLKSREKMNLFIIVINIAVFLYLELTGSTENTMFMLEHGAMYGPLVLEKGEYYRLFTCMFLHFGVEHLAYNMLLLLFAGDLLEKAAGKVRYLLIYLAGGVMGNVISLLSDIKGNDFHACAGASGAIFAVVGALLWIAVRNRNRIGKSLLKRLTIMIVLTIADGFSQKGIDNVAHIGGFVSGFLLCVILLMIPSGAMEDRLPFAEK